MYKTESSSVIQHSTPLSWISSSHSGPSLCEIRRSARMRNLTALLFLLSLCSLHLVSSAPPRFEHQYLCCSEISKAKVPLKNIMTYWKTSSDCPIKAIVFECSFFSTLNKEKKIYQFCVDPKGTWVNRHMKAVDRRNKAPLKAKP